MLGAPSPCPPAVQNNLKGPPVIRELQLSSEAFPGHEAEYRGICRSLIRPSLLLAHLEDFAASPNRQEHVLLTHGCLCFRPDEYFRVLEFIGTVDLNSTVRAKAAERLAAYAENPLARKVLLKFCADPEQEVALAALSPLVTIATCGTDTLTEAEIDDVARSVVSLIGTEYRYKDMLSKTNASADEKLAFGSRVLIAAAEGHEKFPRGFNYWDAQSSLDIQLMSNGIDHNTGLCERKSCALNTEPLVGAWRQLATSAKSQDIRVSAILNLAGWRKISSGEAFMLFQSAGLERDDIVSGVCKTASSVGLSASGVELLESSLRSGTAPLRFIAATGFSRLPAKELARLKQKWNSRTNTNLQAALLVAAASALEPGDNDYFGCERFYGNGEVHGLLSDDFQIDVKTNKIFIRFEPSARQLRNYNSVEVETLLSRGFSSTNSAEKAAAVGLWVALDQGVDYGLTQIDVLQNPEMNTFSYSSFAANRYMRAIDGWIEPPDENWLLGPEGANDMRILESHKRRLVAVENAIYKFSDQLGQALQDLAVTSKLFSENTVLEIAVRRAVELGSLDRSSTNAFTSKRKKKPSIQTQPEAPKPEVMLSSEERAGQVMSEIGRGQGLLTWKENGDVLKMVATGCLKLHADPNPMLRRYANSALVDLHADRTGLKSPAIEDAIVSSISDSDPKVAINTVNDIKVRVWAQDSLEAKVAGPILSRLEAGVWSDDDMKAAVAVLAMHLRFPSGDHYLDTAQRLLTLAHRVSLPVGQAIYDGLMSGLTWKSSSDGYQDETIALARLIIEKIAMRAAGNGYDREIALDALARDPKYRLAYGVAQILDEQMAIQNQRFPDFTDRYLRARARFEQLEREQNERDERESHFPPG